MGWWAGRGGVGKAIEKFWGEGLGWIRNSDLGGVFGGVGLLCVGRIGKGEEGCWV